MSLARPKKPTSEFVKSEEMAEFALSFLMDKRKDDSRDRIGTNFHAPRRSSKKKQSEERSQEMIQGELLANALKKSRMSSSGKRSDGGEVEGAASGLVLAEGKGQAQSSSQHRSDRKPRNHPQEDFVVGDQVDSRSRSEKKNQIRNQPDFHSQPLLESQNPVQKKTQNDLQSHDQSDPHTNSSSLMQRNLDIQVNPVLGFPSSSLDRLGFDFQQHIESPPETQIFNFQTFSKASSDSSQSPIDPNQPIETAIGNPDSNPNDSPPEARQFFEDIKELRSDGKAHNIARKSLENFSSIRTNALIENELSNSNRDRFQHEALRDSNSETETAHSGKKKKQIPSKGKIVIHTQLDLDDPRRNDSRFCLGGIIESNEGSDQNSSKPNSKDSGQENQKVSPPFGNPIGFSPLPLPPPFESQEKLPEGLSIQHDLELELHNMDCKANFERLMNSVMLGELAWSEVRFSEHIFSSCLRKVDCKLSKLKSESE